MSHLGNEIKIYDMKFLINLLNKLISTKFVRAIIGVALAKDKRLCAELMWMAYRDQKVRKAWLHSTKPYTLKHLKQFIRVDISNTARLKQIIAKYGWPGQTLIGSMGCHAAWLLIQHADHDRAFQKQCLILLEKAVENNEAPASLLAYLTDRIRAQNGQPQIFGTQLDGKLNPLPIEDEADVDERRAKVGLPPLSQYISDVKKVMMNEPSLPMSIAELKQLLSQLPPSPEYDTYVAQMKRFLNTMDVL
jgi:hypothetical protein